MRASSDQSEEENSPASYRYAADLPQSFLVGACVGSRSAPISGRERRKAAALEHQPGNDGSDHEDQGGP